MRNNLLLLFSVVSVLVFVGACQHDPFIPKTPTGNNPNTYTGECNPDSVYFTKDIAPLLTSSCSEPGCHDPLTASGGVVLTDYAAMMASDVITPGNLGESDLYEVITETDPDKVMPKPPKPPLTSAQKALIAKWIQQGAKNNSCVADCDSTQFAYAANVVPVLEKYCIGCHSGPNPQGNKSLDTYDGVKKLADNGKLVGSIIHDVNYIAMPYKAGKLSDCQIAIIRKWVEDGAPNN